MPLKILIFSLGIFGLDQITKALALKLLSGLPTLPILPGVFHLTLIQNPGVAFGLFSRHSLAVSVITTLILLGLLWSAFGRTGPRGGFLAMSLGLILGGAMGNLVDRIRFGGVIDFLDFRIWPIFNVADSAITLGAILMAWDLMRGRRR